MNLFYESSDGTRIDLMSSPISAQKPEKLIKNSWEFSTISGANGIGKVKRFYKDSQQLSLTLSIMTEDAESFNEVMYKLHKCFDKDVRRLKPGRLYWNDFYKEVFIIASEPDEFDEFFESIEQQLTILSVRPYWIKKETYSYLDLSQNEGALDYEFDYNFDYDMEELIEVIDNNCIDKANFEIKMYGPCVDPAVTIGSHVYGLNIKLDAGEYVKIDSLNKTIEFFDIYGNCENIFHLRNRESYIFEPIPEGQTTVLRDKQLKIDITLLDERGEPEWI